MSLIMSISIEGADSTYKGATGFGAGIKGGIGISKNPNGSETPYVAPAGSIYYELRVFKRIGIEASCGYWDSRFINMAMRFYNFDNYPFILSSGFQVCYRESGAIDIPSFSIMIKHTVKPCIELLGEACLALTLIPGEFNFDKTVHLYLGMGFTSPYITKQEEKL